MTDRANRERIFVYVRTAEGTRSDLLVYLVGCSVFLLGRR